MSKSFMTVKLGEYLFGMDVSVVREVNRSVDMPPVALAPELIRGLMNLRGQIITVLDPAIRLSLGPCKITNTTRCVVLKTKTEGSYLGLRDITGVLVDSVGDIVNVEPDEIETTPPNVGDINDQFIESVVKLDKDLLIVLNMSKILEPVNQIRDQH